MGISDKRIAWEDEEKEVQGIVLYPIPMRRYSEWLSAKRALTLRQSTLPAAFAVMPYLSALHAMDRAWRTGFLYDVIRLLAMGARRPEACFVPHVYADDPDRLAHIAFHDGCTEAQITPAGFAQIRMVLAEQNGEKLPDEGDNVELLQAEADLLEARSAARLEADANELVTSVAYQYRLRKKELADWSIREFEEARRAIDRDKNHLICALAEKMPMFKWKDGNPAPSWCFDRVKEGSIALESMSEFSKRTGVGGADMPVGTK